MGKNSDGDRLVFADAPETEPRRDPMDKTYKLLIVDDEKQVHVMTKLVLSDYVFDGAGLEFFSAYSMAEAKELLLAHPDAACVLLDVVMETKDAGLEVARYIREEQKNNMIRIILRTGQPGQAPEKEIILNYDINDYKEKTELTTQKLFTSVTTALRSFLHLVELEKKQKEIAAKNFRLNEEISRRIVAEHNLTKYNRSLEKILDSKSEQLRESLKTLSQKEEDLRKACQMAAVGDVSCKSFEDMPQHGKTLEKNIAILNEYRIQTTKLLERYQMLQEIVYSHSEKNQSMAEQATQTLDELERFKKEISFETILKRYPEVIERSVEGIQCISKAISDIQMFISIDEEASVSVDINDLLMHALEEAKEQCGQTVTAQTSYGSVPALLLRPGNTRKAFLEIIKNAIQAVPDSGIISISTSYSAPDVIIQITDIGSGIPPDELGKVFRPYYKKSGSSGRGLGLSFAKTVIDAAGGELQLNTREKEGTTANVRFSAAP